MVMAISKSIKCGDHGFSNFWWWTSEAGGGILSHGGCGEVVLPAVHLLLRRSLCCWGCASATFFTLCPLAYSHVAG
ncbi:hypothetical protein IFM46972_11445 [Aspergillus udagawae]|uniref:Uncharacterized protein n=1 Tax=Aspergillus udagawae TaxID=91492 RepID=A0A8H3XRF7_9EURO|nr:hypothetical protein IFM46972_11445 [Aspergillus udagawae]